MYVLFLMGGNQFNAFASALASISCNHVTHTHKTIERGNVLSTRGWGTVGDKTKQTFFYVTEVGFPMRLLTWPTLEILAMKKIHFLMLILGGEKL